MREKQINEGYAIIEKYVVGEKGFVIGENMTAPSKYVTWCFRTDSPGNFFWGHYFDDKQKALADYHERIETDVQLDYELTGKPPRLPAICMSVSPSKGDIINIKRGESGYYVSDWNIHGDLKYNRKTADHFNDKCDITKAQEAAMLHGSMFGWDTPGADPRNYKENGELQHTVKKNRFEPER